MILYVGNKLLQHGFTPTGIDTLGNKLIQEKYNIKCVSDKRNVYLRFLDIMWNVIKYRKQTKLILIDTYSTLNFYYALGVSLLARAFRIPYVPILRGGNLPSRIKKNPLLSKIIFNHSYKNISPSDYLYSNFKSLGYDVECIPNNIELNLYQFKERETFTPKLLYVRSFHKIYNPEMAIRVFVEILKKYKDATLCMVGPEKDGSLQKTKELVKHLNLEDKVTFTGKLDKPVWKKLAENFDVFINTTDFDNHPVSVIEAMALGLPVVSTEVGGTPFLITNKINGLLVPPGDVGQFVGAVESILDNPEFAKELAQNARTRVELFAWDVVKQKWFELFKPFAAEVNSFSRTAEKIK